MTVDYQLWDIYDVGDGILNYHFIHNETGRWFIHSVHKDEHSDESSRATFCLNRCKALHEDIDAKE